MITPQALTQVIIQYRLWSRAKSDTDDFQVASYLTRNIAECDGLTKKAKREKSLSKNMNSISAVLLIFFDWILLITRAGLPAVNYIIPKKI